MLKRGNMWIVNLEWFRSRRLEGGRYGRLQAMGRIGRLVGVVEGRGEVDGKE
jgi:hypothetical protein